MTQWRGLGVDPDRLPHPSRPGDRSMKRDRTRREFLNTSTAAAVGDLMIPAPAWLSRVAGEPGSRPSAPAIQVVVWDERQPAQKQAYPNFLGNQIADHLRGQPGIAVQSVGLDD